MAKPNQVNTPISKKLAYPESVTITDPCHPLYNQTYPLLHVKNRQELILSCVVQIMPGVRRLVPVSATNLATKIEAVFPAPLDLSSLHNLTQTYARIMAEEGMEWCDESHDQIQGSTRVANDGMANTHRDTTAAGFPDSCAHLPADGKAAGAKES